MKIQASFINKYEGRHGISITTYTPKGFYGKVYKELAPPKWLFNTINSSNNYELCAQLYRQYVLDKLDPYKVLEDIGPNAVLLCIERKNRFHHNYEVIKWLKEKLQK